ncbi:hypothetical protein NDU88_001141 [Pleurodeles waltl]|uniref:Uncharacterized protein n=1 Tax=Pleurodeles waltl TaxID=8319 RepID=A0AAV7U6E5_PLEWA|nr:hypothetical protein NDU88_001141 [Pleurodeles waltl]
MIPPSYPSSPVPPPSLSPQHRPPCLRQPPAPQDCDAADGEGAVRAASAETAAAAAGAAPAPRALQMLRHQGLLKCRCRRLFNDLKEFLLRRAPPTPPLPMNLGECDLSFAANNNTLSQDWGSQAESATLEAEWSSAASAGQHQTSCLHNSTSSEECCKGKTEDRYSLGSSLDSGMRTPLCRICFQGPEQVGLHVY